MINLYFQNNTDFENNGNIILTPLSCYLEAEINGAWQLKLKHPLDTEGRYKYIQSGCVIKAPSFNGEQLFRITQAERRLEYVEAYADPIFLDSLNEVFIFDKRPTAVNGQTALNQIFSGTKYSGKSDIVKTATAYYIQKNAIEAINGTDENAFTNRWGGQIIYDNFNVIINQRAGGDYGVKVAYGKNILGIRETVNRDSIITRIIPKAYNGYMLAGTQPWVDSPLINSYPIVYTRVVEFDDVKLQQDCSGDEVGFKNLTLLRNELKRRANLMFTEQQVDRELVTLEINIALLENSAEYDNYKILEKISLGDTVQCEHYILGISTSAQAVAIRYDCIKDRTDSVTLGRFQPSFFNSTTITNHAASKAIRNDGTVVAQQIQGAINALNAYFHSQNTAAQRQEARAMLFEDTDTDSELYGALSIGTKGIEIANERTADDRDWNWKTAITANGIIADELIGQVIKGIEIIADRGKIGKFVIDNGQETDGGGFYGDYGNWRVFFQPAYDNAAGVNKTWVVSTQYKGENGYKATYILYADGRQEHFEGSDFYNFGTSIRSGSRDGNSYNMIAAKNGGDIDIGESSKTTSILSTNVGLGRFNISLIGWKLDGDADYVNRDTIETKGNAVFAANGGNSELNLVASRIRSRAPHSFHGSVNFGDDVNFYGNSYFSYVVNAKNGVSGGGNNLELYGKSFIHSNNEFRLNFKSVSGTVPLAVGTNGQITTSTSSKRYKENITDEIPPELNPELLYNLPVVVYNYKEEFKDIELVAGTQIGITAEDVKEFYPNAVILNADGQAESWQERIILPAMLKLLQDQHNQILTQQQRIDELESRLSAIEKMLTENQS